MSEEKPYQVTLSNGSHLSISEAGLTAVWMVDENMARRMTVAWPRILRIRRFRYGNPFEVMTPRHERRETGLLIEAEPGSLLLVDAYERSFETTSTQLRNSMGERWSRVFDSSELAVVHGGVEGQAPDTLRRPFRLVRDPRSMPRGEPVSEEPEMSWRGRRRRWLSRGLLKGGVGSFFVSQTVVLFLFRGALPQGVVGWLLPVLGVVGVAFATTASIDVARFLDAGKIRLHENGLEIPRVMANQRLQFIPFELMDHAERKLTPRLGPVFTIHTFPWVAPIEVPEALPRIEELLKANGKLA